MNDAARRQEFQELADAWIDGRATEEQTRRLEQLATSSPELMRQLVDMSLLNASLSYVADSSSTALNMMSNNEQATGQGRFRHLRFTQNYLVAIAVTMLMCMTVFFLLWKALSERQNFASLESIAGTRWISASIPTNSGSKIGSGHLKLAAGLVTMRFDVGAVIELEGPADLEIINRKRCRLNSGKLLATVRNHFRGFVIETPNAILTDQGTSFCVSVQPDGESNMQVLEGRVDVEDRTTGVEKTVLGQRGVRMTRGTISDSFDVEQGTSERAPMHPSEANVIYLPTSVGKGADYWVQRNESRPGSESQYGMPILLVKWSKEECRIYDRKAYLRFDLSGIPSDQLSNASLTLNAIPSGLGFASMTIDSKMAIYGVHDDLLDSAQTDSVWGNAPASSESGGSVDLNSAQLLGKFIIPQGVQEGTFSIQSDELLNYLKKDTNRIVTMILVCETQSVASMSLVFGFAGSNNSIHTPPTLRLEYQK